MVFWRVHTLYLSADKSNRCLSLSVVSYDGKSAHTSLYQNAISAMLRQCLHSCVMYSAWNPKDNYDMRARFFIVQI